MKKYIPMMLMVFLNTSYAQAEIGSALENFQRAMFSDILPVFALLGLGFAAFSFFTGNPNAKQHLTYAISGAMILYGAGGIIDLIKRVMR